MAWPRDPADAARERRARAAVGRLRARGVRDDAALLRALSRLPPVERDVALEILARRRHRPACATFLRLVRDGSWGDVVAFAYDFAQMGSARHLDAVVRLVVEPPSERARWNALEVLRFWDAGRLGPRAGARLVAALVRAARAPRDAVSPRGAALEMLGCAVGDGIDRRSAAARAAVDALVEAAADPSPWIRADAAYGLGQTHSARAVPALRALRRERTRVGSLGTVGGIADRSLRQVAHARGKPRHRWTV